MAESVIYLGLLALIVIGAIWMYGYLLLRDGKAVIAAMRALRDRIDNTKHWP